MGESRLIDLLEWIDGREPDDEEVVECFGVLGELARALPQPREPLAAVPAGFVPPALGRDDAARRCPSNASRPAWDNWALTAEQRALVLECRDVLRERLGRWGKERERYGMIHSDLMPDNLLLTADGVRLIDFDDAGFGWYLYDAASALLAYYGSDLYEPLLASWLRGYRGQRPLPDAELAELPTFLLLRCFYALGWLHLRRNSAWADGIHRAGRDMDDGPRTPAPVTGLWCPRLGVPHLGLPQLRRCVAGSAVRRARVGC